MSAEKMDTIAVRIAHQKKEDGTFQAIMVVDGIKSEELCKEVTARMAKFISDKAEENIINANN